MLVTVGIILGNLLQTNLHLRFHNGAVDFRNKLSRFEMRAQMVGAPSICSICPLEAVTLIKGNI
jgi:hypothetical protein